MAIYSVLTEINDLNERLKLGNIKVEEFTRELERLVDKAVDNVDDLLNENDEFRYYI